MFDLCIARYFCETSLNIIDASKELRVADNEVKCETFKANFLVQLGELEK